jgi:isoquinoline 1-oxidoreductase subunit beta
MVVAAVIHPPRFGGKVKSFDVGEAKSVKGFLDAKIVPQGLAVYATSTWPAFKARGLIKVEWDDSAAEMRGSDELLAEYRKLADSEGLKVRNDGDAAAALASAAQTVEGEFTFPYLAHAARLNMPAAPSAAAPCPIPTMWRKPPWWPKLGASPIQSSSSGRAKTI